MPPAAAPLPSPEALPAAQAAAPGGRALRPCEVCRRWSGVALCADCLARFAAPRPRCVRCAIGLGVAAPACGACLTGLGVWGLIQGAQPSIRLRQKMQALVGIAGGTVLGTITDNAGVQVHAV